MKSGIRSTGMRHCAGPADRRHFLQAGLAGFAGLSLPGMLRLRAEHPTAKVIAHPECEPHVLAMADFIGSTTRLLEYAVNSEHQVFIVVTESGILTQMHKQAPHKTFIPAPPEAACACNECPFMRLNTLEKLYVCLRDMTPELDMPVALREAARKPIDRMLALS